MLTTAWSDELRPMQHHGVTEAAQQRINGVFDTTS